MGNGVNYSVNGFLQLPCCCLRPAKGKYRVVTCNRADKPLPLHIVKCGAGGIRHSRMALDDNGVACVIRGDNGVRKNCCKFGKIFVRFALALDIAVNTVLVHLFDEPQLLYVTGNGSLS